MNRYDTHDSLLMCGSRLDHRACAELDERCGDEELDAAVDALIDREIDSATVKLPPLDGEPEPAWRAEEDEG